MNKIKYMESPIVLNLIKTQEQPNSNNNPSIEGITMKIHDYGSKKHHSKVPEVIIHRITQCTTRYSKVCYYALGANMVPLSWDHHHISLHILCSYEP